jgi:hypothetical protein
MPDSVSCWRPDEETVEAVRHVLRDGDKRIGRIVIRVRELPVPEQVPGAEGPEYTEEVLLPFRLP